MRDERVEAFTSYLAGGIYEYTYVARATTPGKFVVPPAKAEEMYSPETFGRSASTTVVVGGRNRFVRVVARAAAISRRRPVRDGFDALDTAPGGATTSWQRFLTVPDAAE